MQAWGMVNFNIDSKYFIFAGEIILGIIVFFGIYWFMKRKQKKKQEKPKKATLNKVATKTVVPKKIEIRQVVELKNKLIPKEDIEKKQFYYEVEPRDYFKRSRFSIRYWRDRRKARKKPHKIVLVRFHLDNGRVREFLVPQTSSFVYGGNRYIFDLNLGYMNLDSGILCYDFHESLCLPIKQGVRFNDSVQDLIDEINKQSSDTLKKPVKLDIDVNEIKDTIEASEIIETETSLNPSVLQRLIEAEIAQGVLRGATLGKVIKVLFIMVIIIGLIVTIDVLVDLSSSGLLEELNVGKKE